MNMCLVYCWSGGYFYIYFIFGFIGINLGMVYDLEKYYDNLLVCFFCMFCLDVCLVKVDLVEQIYKWRQDLDKIGKVNMGKKIMFGGMKVLMDYFMFFNVVFWVVLVVNYLLCFMKYNDLDVWGKG